MIEFDHAVLARRLAKISERARLLFAAMVAERLFPHAVKFFQEQNPEALNQVRLALECVWSVSAGDAVSDSEREAALAGCMDAIQAAARIATNGESYPLTGVQRKVAEQSRIKPLRVRDIPSHDRRSDAAFFAENAATAIAYGLRAVVANDPSEPAWAAQTAYDSVDRFVMVLERELGMRWTEVEILSHPIVQRELQRQLDDISSLGSLSARSLLDKSAVAKLRYLARQQAQSVFTP